VRLGYCRETEPSFALRATAGRLLNPLRRASNEAPLLRSPTQFRRPTRSVPGVRVASPASYRPPAQIPPQRPATPSSQSEKGCSSFHSLKHSRAATPRNSAVLLHQVDPVDPVKRNSGAASFPSFPSVKVGFYFVLPFPSASRMLSGSLRRSSTRHTTARSSSSL